MGQINGIDDVGERAKDWAESAAQQTVKTGSDIGGQMVRKGSDAVIKSFRNGSKAAKDSIQNAINTGAAPASTAGATMGTSAGAVGGTTGATAMGTTAGATAMGTTATGVTAGATGATAGATGSAATGATATGATATGVNLTNPVGWAIIIVSLVLFLLLIGYIAMALVSFFVGDKASMLAYLDYENVGDYSESTGSYSADKSKMSSANLAVLAYYEELSSKTVLQEYTDEDGNVIYIPYNDERAVQDKYGRDKDLRIDYNLLYSMNDAVFSEEFVYPEAFLKPVAHDEDYNLCAISDEDGNLNTLFTTGESNMSYPDKNSTEETTEESAEETSVEDVSEETSAENSDTSESTESSSLVDKAKEVVEDVVSDIKDFVDEVATDEESSDTQEESEQKVSIKDTDFVVVKDYIPDITISLAYATEENFVKKKIYTDNICYLRYGTVKKLSKVQEAVKKAGYGGLLIWDGYRSQSAVDALYEAYPDKTYVAKRSNHTKGNTVDLTIVDKSGNIIEMPSEFDTFNATADTDYSDVSKQAGLNSAYLTEVMQENGFVGYNQEWWHFTDSDDYEYQDSLTVSSNNKKSDKTSTVDKKGSDRTATANFDDVGISTLCSYKKATSSTYLKGTYVSKVSVNSETGEETSEPLAEPIAYNIPLKTESFYVLDKMVSMWESVTYSYSDTESRVNTCKEGRSASASENVSHIQQEDEVRQEEVEVTVTKYPVVDDENATVKEFDSEEEAKAYIEKESDKGYILGTPYETTETVTKDVVYHIYYVRDSNSGLYNTSCAPSGTDRKTYDNTYLYQYLQSAVIESPNIERDYETFKNFSSYAGTGAFANATLTKFGSDGEVSATTSQQEFIDTFSPLCIEEAKQTGIYPSLIMGQIILESGWGTSPLSIDCSNYVGMTAHSKNDGSVITFWDGSTWTYKTYAGTDRGWADFSNCGSPEANIIACIRYYGYNFWVSGYYDSCGALSHISKGLSPDESKADCLKQLSEYAPIYAPPSENYNYEGEMKKIMDNYNLYELNDIFISEGGWDGTTPYEKKSSGGKSSSSSSTGSFAQAGTLNQEDLKTFSMFFHATDKEVLDEIKNLTYETHHLNLGETDVDEILRMTNRFTYGLSVDEEQEEFSHDDLLSMSLLIKDRDQGYSKGGASPATDWVFYLQYEGDWADKMYGSNDYTNSGCGPTSLAMVIASLIDDSVTPDIVGDACVEAGYRTANQGTKDGYCLALADKFGYYCEVYQVTDKDAVQKVEDCLRSGGAVCWSSGSQPFTSAGHCMALRGITEDGKWLVADPNDNDDKNHNTTEFDPEFITSRWHNVVELIWVEKP